MTVLIYVDASKQLGDHEHLKVFANADAAEAWFAETTPKAWPLSTTCSKRIARQLRRPPSSFRENEKPGNRPRDRSKYRC